MSRTLNTIFITALTFLALAILGGLVWANMSYVRAHPNEKDFLIPWLGARTFLHEGVSPYDQSATQRAQIVYYGRLAGAGENPLQLAIPLFVEIFYFPFALIIDYTFALGLWMTFLEIALVTLAFLVLNLTNWQPPRLLRVSFLLFSTLWVYALLTITSGSVIIFCAAAVVGALAALRAEKEELAGALLLVASFQPLMCALFLLFILLWVFDHRRWRVLLGFLMAIIMLIILSFMFLPDWFLPWIRALIAEYKFTSTVTPGIIFTEWFPAIGRQLGWALSGIIIVLLFLEWRGVHRYDYRRFLWAASLSITVYPLLGLPASPANHILLLLPLTLLISVASERWKGILATLLTSGLLLVFFLGLWLTAMNHAVLFLALPLILVIGLYWIRWWAIHPPRTGLENLGE